MPVDSKCFPTRLFLWNSHLKIYPDQFGIDSLKRNVSKVKEQQEAALPVTEILEKLD